MNTRFSYFVVFNLYNVNIVVVAEGRDLYEGLDVYFDASMVN